jgi:hypothetical protein
MHATMRTVALLVFARALSGYCLCDCLEAEMVFLVGESEAVEAIVLYCTLFVELNILPVLGRLF